MLPALQNGFSLSRTMPVNRLFDSFFNDEFFNLGAPEIPATQPLTVSLWQDDDNVYVEADVPGMTEKDLDVSYQNGVLAICGERKWEKKENGYDRRAYGRFEQHVVLPTEIESDQIRASLTHGVLRLTLSKAEQAKPRRIAIRAE
jgi:HSP20 family protein